jgi:hypothetical protein
LRLSEQIKQIRPVDRGQLAIAGLDENDLRAVVTHGFFAWHAELDKRAAEKYWRDQGQDEQDS